jgi:hypothetical protein
VGIDTTVSIGAEVEMFAYYYATPGDYWRSALTSSSTMQRYLERANGVHDAIILDPPHLWKQQDPASLLL